MKRVKKIMAVITILAFVFGGFLPVAAANGGQELSAGSGETVVSKPVSEESGAVAAPAESITSCTVPTMIYLNDGLGGVDVDYFNTKDEISANWDFDDKGCLITEYKYRVIKFAGPTPWQVITGWIPTTDKFATVDLISLALPSLIEGEKYGIKVIAKNSEGPSEKYKTDGQTLDLTSPVMNYFALQQDRPYGGGINLIWVPATDLNEIASYQIYRNGLIYDTVSGITSTYVDAISGDNVEFTYYIKAVDVAGNISESSNLQSAVVDDVAPAAPSISYWIGGKNIVIFFPAVPGASNYEIYRNGVLIKSGAETKYTDTNTVRGQTYSYNVYALDEAGNRSLISNMLEIYIPKPKVSSVATTGEVQGTATGTTEKTEQISPSPSPSPGEVKAEESSAPEETQEEAKTNWSLIIAIIIAAAIVVAGVLYWWYAREEEEEDEI